MNRCVHCGVAATCIGAYEGQEELSFACEGCCAHGCEDGQCWPLSEIREIAGGLERTARYVLGQACEFEDMPVCLLDFDYERGSAVAMVEAGLLRTGDRHGRALDFWALPKGRAVQAVLTRKAKNT